MRVLQPVTRLRCLVAVGALGMLVDCAVPTARSGDREVSVHGVVHYAGKVEGPLVVGVFRSFPPRGPPLASERIERPAFPQAYAFDHLPDGRYFVLAIVDSDPMDGERYHPKRDPGGAYGFVGNPWSLSISNADGAQQIDIELSDPSASSPWKY